MAMPLLSIKQLTLDFDSGAGSVRVIDDLSLSLERGEILGLAGESGCGKSVTAASIARLVPTPPGHYRHGEIFLGDRDVLRMSAAELRHLRGGTVSYVFQDPGASLNPVMSVGAQIREALRLHRPQAATTAEVIRLLQQVGIPAPELRHKDYPFQLSGGMQQRVMIAMALASKPQLLVADEPTTALDVTIQAQILDLLRELNQRLGMAILLITHNLGLLAGMAHRVAVMYAGQIVEIGPGTELFQRPLHPYTRALIEAMPRLGTVAPRLAAIPGTVPSPGTTLPGCRFAARCGIARPSCHQESPQLIDAGSGHWVRCPYTSAGAQP